MQQHDETKHCDRHLVQVNSNNDHCYGTFKNSTNMSFLKDYVSNCIDFAFFRTPAAILCLVRRGTLTLKR